VVLELTTHLLQALEILVDQVVVVVKTEYQELEQQIKDIMVVDPHLMVQMLVQEVLVAVVLVGLVALVNQETPQEVVMVEQVFAPVLLVNIIRLEHLDLDPQLVDG
jgi:hypothetical protein